MCSVRSGYVDEKVGAASMAETTWVIPRLASWVVSLAVARQVRYRRGATLLAALLLFAAVERRSRFIFSVSSCRVAADRREESGYGYR